MIEADRPKTGMRRWVARATAGSAGLVRVNQEVEQPPLAATHAVTIAQFDSRSYDDGLRAGVQARLRSAPITPYQRVGLDEFTRGFRAGYFSSRARGSQVGDSLEGRAAS